mgnify:CR=1 FL=1
MNDLRLFYSCLATEVAEIGGHDRILWNWDRVPRILLFSTDVGLDAV